MAVGRATRRFHPHGVVEIPRGFAVDGDDIEVAKIAAAGELGRRNRSGNGAGLFQNLVGKVMRDVMRTDENLDVDAEVVGQAEDFDDAADGTVAVFAEVHDFGGDDHPVQILDRAYGDGGRAHAVDGHLAGGERHVFGDLDPLADALVMGNDEIARAPDAELADHGEMGAAQHAHDLAIGLAIVLDAGDPRDDAIPVHRAGGGLLGDVDVAAQAGNGDFRNHEAVAVAVHVEASHGEFAADAGGGVMPGACFDNIAALGQAIQLGFNLLAGGAVTGAFAQQLFERRAAVRQLANVLDQGQRHVPL